MRIAIVGLGYVGAPLAVELAKHFTVVGYDVNPARVAALSQGIDHTHEIAPETLAASTCTFVDDCALIQNCNVYIITVPTPIDAANVPDLNAVRSASHSIGHLIKKGDIIVYESTVYPGVTEEICVPILEAASGLIWKKDFNVGYSPERINPGDKINTLTTTTKIVSGDSEETLQRIASIYQTVTQTYRASSIKVAEAAKVIENTQRDVNIALMNELSQIFSHLGIDTHDVINAAKSKWNFLPFTPGLVGGHCISVDPYYLSYKAAVHGIVSDVILSARKINDSMANHVVAEIIKKAMNLNMTTPDIKVTILGVTFKANVPDIRNSKVYNMVQQFKKYGIKTQVVDPHASKDEVQHEFNFQLQDANAIESSEILIVAVPHQEYVEGGWDMIATLLNNNKKCIVADLGAVLDRALKPAHVELWRL
ncbi:nucleotide sugar dehydrogenase [Hydromonas duriensis]|uniref:UDP-N-acetyl-D-galactosamine dehydrogenase n=1 Tax=Hydromonas duriensis TaxID=1527608 RepID=A0A4R6Y7F6_9BURK|nr:nucleotide sugar dehydrogenase [Hydromonas duriensis]TDR31264.1 UDP-N-acetyl-D-galactosamine dehydrogenase [Hydromonas duriensis]